MTITSLGFAGFTLGTLILYYLLPRRPKYSAARGLLSFFGQLVIGIYPQFYPADRPQLCARFTKSAPSYPMPNAIYG